MEIVLTLSIIAGAATLIHNRFNKPSVNNYDVRHQRVIKKTN